MTSAHWVTAITLALTLTGCTASNPPEPGSPPPPLSAAAPADALGPVPPLANTGPWITVTEVPGGKPVANALVWVSGISNMGRTDEQGRAQLASPLPLGEQTLVVTPSDLSTHKESQYHITVPAGVQQEYSLVVSPDRPLTFDHGKEVPIPAFSPAPQRVSPDKIERSDSFRMVHALRTAHSAWSDGEAQAEGFWEPFVVWTNSDPDHPVIGTYLLNGGGRWTVKYESPRPTGLLTITGIDETGLLISFTSTSDTSGTFHLLTHEWHID